jgi:TusA-related sulfurtransferase
MLLGQMKTGQVLSVLLDEEGGKSVPKSAEKDGHAILLEQQQGDRWLVLLRKG